MTDEIVSAQDVIPDSPPPSRALVPVKRGRGQLPIELTPEMVDAICDALADGKKIADIAKLPGMPSRSTLRRLIVRDEQFRKDYAMAKEELADGILLDIIPIADDDGEDFELTEAADGLPTVAPNKKALGRSELQVNTRFRVLAQLVPRKYGEKALPPPEGEVNTPPPNRNGDDARVIEGHVIPLEQHPLYDSIMAWGRVADEAAAKAKEKKR